MPVIPEFQRRRLQGPKSNFSLYFSRMTDWVFGRDEIQSRDGEIVTLGETGNRLLRNVGICLASIHHRQRRLVDQATSNGQLALEIRARLKTPFVSGLGSGHPTETGMILDRNTGVPYIPASSIKGVLRLAHAVNLLNNPELDQKWIKFGTVNSKGVFNEHPDGNQINLDDREPSLRRYFGDVDTKAKEGVRGQIVFLDAYPEHVPMLKPDIMNPHFQKYYGASTKEDVERGPVDCEDPIPVKFLSVTEGTVFIFRVLISPLSPLATRNGDEIIFRSFDDQDHEVLIKMFKRAFITLGMGGKTAIGYGRFEIVEKSDESALKQAASPAPSAAPLELPIWEQASVSYAPGTQMLTATYAGKKAMIKGKDLVPETYHKALFEKKKAINAKVTVRAEGNMFQIIKIE